MKVTPEAIKAKIRHVTYTRGPASMTHCYLHLDNGYLHHGYSACVDPQEFDDTLGRKAAYDNAFGTLWQLMGFLLAEDMWRERAKAELKEHLGDDYQVKAHKPFGDL
jgi:hypothetical protein